MKATIEVTQSDIYNGHRNECNKCPIALAMSRYFKCEVTVAYNYCQIPNKLGGSIRIINSEVMQRFIDDFDSGRPVQPFSFEISY